MSLPVLQLANRLANASTTSERIAVLNDLHGVAKKNCAEVGKNVLHLVIDMLKENGEPEEYTESLDLISRLVDPKHGQAAAENTDILLEDVMTIELLLDLLEHQDGLVAVMASEILTNVHTIEPERLEGMIQRCPAGMTKLLNRVPDRTREEVSNQAIILIQQLTVSNEEMKKAVAFNEGFDALFGIIESEGGCKEPSAVVQDCLKICFNVLNGSETCQRLFYEMGGGWHFRLLDFFSPDVLEAVHRVSVIDDIGENERLQQMWFEHPVRLNCAVYAVRGLVASMGGDTIRASEGKAAVVSSSADEIVRACAHWVIRGGPHELLSYCFLLIEKIAQVSDSFAAKMFDLELKYQTTANGVHIPSEVLSSQSVHLRWSSHLTEDQRIISLPCLLADRYVFTSAVWNACDNEPSSEDSILVPQNCLRILNSMLERNEMASGMVLQRILAPPPPDEFLDDMDFNPGKVASRMDFGVAVFTELVRSLGAVADMQGPGSALSAAECKHNVEIVFASSNILALVFLHGGSLASELATAVSTAHLLSDLSSKQHESLHILPYLLSTLSRVVRVSGVGYDVASSVLSVLSVAAKGSERASRQMFEDPTNLFIVELASKSSENAGVSRRLQVMCAFFIGCVMQSLPEASSVEHDLFSRHGMLEMIDSKISLSRYNDLIEYSKATAPSPSSSSLLLSPGPEHLAFAESFKLFFKSQSLSIRNAIYRFYAGGSAADGDVDEALSAEKKVIKMQLKTISDLELEVDRLQSSNGQAEPVKKCDDKTVKEMERKIAEKDDEIKRYDEKCSSLEEDMSSLKSQLQNSRSECEHLVANASNGSADAMEAMSERLDNALARADKLEKENQELRARDHQFDDERRVQKDEIVRLKEEILLVSNAKKSMADEADALRRRLSLLEEDLKSAMPFEKINEGKIAELEKRNSDLKAEIWEKESNMSNLQHSVERLVRAMSIESDHQEGSVEESLETCLEGLHRLAGRCSDLAEGCEVHFESSEDAAGERICECVERLVDLLRTSEEKISEGEEVSMQLRASEEDLERLQGDYDVAFSRLSEVEGENVALKHECEMLRQAVESLRGDDSQLRNSLEQNQVLSEELQVSREAQQRTARENAKLIEQLRTLEETLVGGRDTQQALSSECNELKNRLEVASVELSHFKSEHDRLSVENEANQAVTSRLSAEYEQLQAEYDDKTSELEAMKAAREDAVQVRRELDSAQSALSESQQALCGRETHINDLKALLAEKDRKVEALTQGKLHLEDSLEAKSKEYNDLLENFIEQKEKLAKLTERSEMERASFDADKTAAGTIAGLNDVIKGLESEVDHFYQQKEEMRSSHLLEVQQLKDDYRKKFSALEDELLAAARREVSPEALQSVHSSLLGLWGEVFRADDSSSSLPTQLRSCSDSDTDVSSAMKAIDETLKLLTKEVHRESSDGKKLDCNSYPQTPNLKRRGESHVNGHTPLPLAAQETPQSTRESARLFADLRKERHRLHRLQEQHSDLLGLLAQQEVELQVYRQSLQEAGGVSACQRADEYAVATVTERYGTYVKFRDADEGVVV